MRSALRAAACLALAVLFVCAAMTALAAGGAFPLVVP